MFSHVTPFSGRPSPSFSTSSTVEDGSCFSKNWLEASSGVRSSYTSSISGYGSGSVDPGSLIDARSSVQYRTVILKYWFSPSV